MTNCRHSFFLLRQIRVAAVVGSMLTLLIGGCSHYQPSSQAHPLTEPIVQPAATVAGEYTVGAGDVLEISAWKDPALTRQVAVLPDGTISFPLVGRCTAAGKTVDQLRDEMETALKQYIPEPDLSLIVQQVNSQVVYVIGKVNRPGHFALNRDIDVLQALAMAGGLNIFADDQDIRIFRKTARQTMVIPFDYKAVTEENQLDGNIQLQRGDVVVVK